MSNTGKTPAKNNLVKPRSVGMTDRLWADLERIAKEKEDQLGERVSVSRVVAEASLEYLMKHRPAPSTIFPPKEEGE